jgi:hypothetical protein
MTISRRHFLGAIAVAAAASGLRAQSPGSSQWGGPVLDIHLHLRQNPEANVVHMDGCGVSNAVLLARESSSDQIKSSGQPSGPVFMAASADITRPEAEGLLTKAIRNGAVGFGEIKFQVPPIPRARRMYALAADRAFRS